MEWMKWPGCCSRARLARARHITRAVRRRVRCRRRRSAHSRGPSGARTAVVRDHGDGAHLEGIVITRARAAARRRARAGVAASCRGRTHLAANLDFVSDVILKLIGATDELYHVAGAGLG